MYTDLLRIQNPQTRCEMIQTVLAGQEYIAAAKQSGVYGQMLNYVAKVRGGLAPPILPGEQGQQQVLQPLQNQIVYAKQTASVAAAGDRVSASTHVAKGRRNEKALTYFQNCLRVLGLEEEVALTEEALKKAYKKAAVMVHPDKGGTEEQFEAVTRAHAYLGEILQRIRGGRTKESVVEAPTALKDGRQTESKQWEMIEPVRLNPKKLDMNAFNQMFEQTRMPDPEDEGYGDWLKAADEPETKKFGGKFNRDVFNRAFEDEARKRASQSSQLTVMQPQALTMMPNQGVELGRVNKGDYTAAANANLKYTDLKHAYTTQNMITNQVSDVKVEARSFDNYSASRKKAPDPLTNHEAQALAESEAAMARSEMQRQVRAAAEGSAAAQYFERMKQLVITQK
jgi:curved DNA-binding protein CbpA